MFAAVTNKCWFDDGAVDSFFYPQVGSCLLRSNTHPGFRQAQRAAIIAIRE